MDLKAGEMAVPFELEQLEGGLWRLAERLERGPALVVFAKEACPTCRFALPLVDRIFRAYPEEKCSVVVVAQEEREGARRLVRELDLKMPVLLDPPPHPVSRQYRLSFVPAFIYVNREGQVEQAVDGFAREELASMNRKLAAAAGQGPVDWYGEEKGIPAFRPG